MATQAVSETDFDNPRRSSARSVSQLARRRLRVPDGVINDTLLTREAREKRLVDALRDEAHAADLARSLFGASLISYRRPTICNPFPQEIITRDGPDFETAESLLRAFPDTDHLARNPHLVANLPTQALNLFDWIVSSDVHEGFSLHKVSTQEYEGKASPLSRRHLSVQNAASRPNFVFEVRYSPTNQLYRQFKQNVEQYGSFVAYHGSGLENFHSILRHGLDDTFSNSMSIYGEGVYLSEDRDVGYQFVKMGNLEIPSSYFGNQIAILACCEVARHPSVRTHDQNKNSKYQDSDLLVDGQSQLPSGYVVVNQPQFVMARYILVYVTPSAAAATAGQPRATSGAAVARRKSNICQYLFILYIAVLLFVWFAKNRNSVGFVTWREYIKTLGL